MAKTKGVMMTVGENKRKVCEDELRSIQRQVCWSSGENAFSANDLSLLDALISYVCVKHVK